MLLAAGTFRLKAVLHALDALENKTGRIEPILNPACLYFKPNQAYLIDASGVGLISTLLLVKVVEMTRCNSATALL